MTKQLNIRFYQNVAKLFYAIAAADKVVRDEEHDKLKNIVNIPSSSADVCKVVCGVSEWTTCQEVT